MNNQISAQTEAELLDFIESLTGSRDNFAASHANGIHCVVLLGRITEQYGTYDEDGNELTAPVLSERYHADILADRELELPEGIERHFPEHPKHGFT